MCIASETVRDAFPPFFLAFFPLLPTVSFTVSYFLGVSLELREGPERHVFRSLRGRHSKGKGKGTEGARPRAREEGNLSFPALARSRAPKFPLPLLLLTPATQATYFVSCKELGIPESGNLCWWNPKSKKFLLVESGLRNPERWNP